jgi:hypothetical protein
LAGVLRAGRPSTCGLARSGFADGCECAGFLLASSLIRRPCRSEPARDGR